MNQLQLSGMAGMVMGGVFYAGGYVVENMEANNADKKALNNLNGHSLKTSGAILATGGVALYAVGKLIGDNDGGSEGFYGAGIPV